MCVVSNVTDYGQKHIWPKPDDWKIQPAVPFPWVDIEIAPNGPPPPTKITPPPLSHEEVRKIREFLKLIEKAKEIDRLTNQPDCPDPEKVEWLKKLVERAEGIENLLNQIAEGKK